MYTALWKSGTQCGFRCVITVFHVCFKCENVISLLLELLSWMHFLFCLGSLDNHLTYPNPASQLMSHSTSNPRGRPTLSASSPSSTFPPIGTQVSQLCHTIQSRLFGRLLTRQQLAELVEPEWWRWYKVLHIAFVRVSLLVNCLVDPLALTIPHQWLWIILQVINLYPLKRLFYDTPDAVTDLSTTYHLSLGRWDRLICTLSSMPRLYCHYCYWCHGHSYIHAVQLFAGIAKALIDTFCHPDTALSRRSLIADIARLMRSAWHYGRYFGSLTCGIAPPLDDVVLPQFHATPLPNYVYTSIWWMACMDSLAFAALPPPLVRWLQMLPDIDLNESISEFVTGERAAVQSLLHAELHWTSMPLWFGPALLLIVAFIAFAKAHLGEMFCLRTDATQENKQWYALFALCNLNDNGHNSHDNRTRGHSLSPTLAKSTLLAAFGEQAGGGGGEEQSEEA